MTTDEILNIQTEILKTVLDNDQLHVTRDTTAEHIDEWDSLTHIQIVAAVEAKFKIRFALSELHTLKNVGEMVDLISHKLGTKN